MRRAFVGGRLAGMAAAVLLVALSAQAQTPPGPTTTPSGSYLNLQPRRQRQMPQPPLVAPGRWPRADATTPREARQVVCGLTVITPPAGIDDAMVRPVAKDGPRPTIRAVEPPVCAPGRQNPPR